MVEGSVQTSEPVQSDTSMFFEGLAEKYREIIGATHRVAFELTGKDRLNAIARVSRLATGKVYAYLGLTLVFALPLVLSGSDAPTTIVLTVVITTVLTLAVTWVVSRTIARIRIQSASRSISAAALDVAIGPGGVVGCGAEGVRISAWSRIKAIDRDANYLYFRADPAVTPIPLETFASPESADVYFLAATHYLRAGKTWEPAVAALVGKLALADVSEERRIVQTLESRDVIAAYKQSWRDVPHTTFWIRQALFAVACLGLGYLIERTIDKSPISMRTLAFAAIINGAGWAYSRLRIARIAKNHRAVPMLGQQLVYGLTSQGVHGAGIQSASIIAWPKVGKIVDRDDYILFVLEQNSGMIPLRRGSFATPAEADRFLKEAQAYHQVARDTLG